MILIMKLAIPARYCLPWLCRHREHLTDCTLHGYENSPDTKKNEIFMDKKNIRKEKRANQKIKLTGIYRSFTFAHTALLLAICAKDE
jgi:hypothetical protein